MWFLNTGKIEVMLEACIGVDHPIMVKQIKSKKAVLVIKGTRCLGSDELVY